MKFLSRSALFALALFAAAAAHATTFTFSYTFNSPAWFGLQPTTVMSGTFNGTASGNLIDGLSNMSVFENGVAFAGNGNLFSSYVNGDGTVTLFAGVASFDGMQNNFNFTDGQNNNFFMGPDPYEGGLYAIDVGTASIQGPAPANWTITAQDSDSVVPEPGTMALLAGGLAILALRTRHRKLMPIGC